MRYITAVLAALGLLLLGTVSAQADEQFTLAETGECGTTTITTSATEGTLVVQADGEQFTTAAPGSIEVGPFGGDVDVRYRIAGGPERDWDIPAWDIARDDLLAYIEEHGSAFNDDLTFDQPSFVGWKSTTVTGCTVATPVEPTLTQPTCDEPEAKLTVPEVEGVAYEGSGDPTPGHMVTVIATPTDGYVFDGEQEVVYTFDIAAVPGCDGAPSEPGQDGKDGTDGEDAAVPTSIPAGEQLPKTGVSPVLAGLVGAGLLGAGGGLLAWQRRKVTNI